MLYFNSTNGYIKYIIMERIVRILNIKWNLKEEQNLR